MKLSQLEKLLLQKNEAVKEFPFGPDCEVFKVRGKMFALITEREGRLAVNLKSDPAEAEALRSSFDDIIPGYHMNKRHWNTVYIDRELPDDLIKQMVNDSYLLVVSSLKKSDQKELLK